MMQPEFNWVPIAISATSLIIACVALGWNVYRDVILKPKIRVRLSISSIVEMGVGELDKVVMIEATNFGPGVVSIINPITRKGNWVDRQLGNVEHGVILQDNQQLGSTRLPCRLEVAEKATIILPYNKGIFLSSSPTDVGVSDTFGRSHWANRKDVRAAKRRWRRKFAGSEVEA